MKKLVSAIGIAAFGASTLVACGSGDGSGSAADFCEKFIAVEDSDVNPDEDFDGAVKLLEEVRDAAPSEIKDDVATMVDAMKKLENVEDADIADLDFDFAEIEAASDRIEAYGESNCELGS